MVVANPGEWFAEVLHALAAQDYPNLQTLFFVVDGGADDVVGQIRTVLPGAIVRIVEGNPGWGPVQNQVLRLVEGDAGFFCFLHDDVALEPGSISSLIEETFRSNAGLVGPKLVDWTDSRVLLHVGVGVDRLGERVSVVDPGEIDQEQHDAVRDVFTVPSACLLVRADLFRELGGFCPEIDFHGEDLDLCWRVHLSGARVLVVPSARVRHRGQFALRRPDLESRSDIERHRVLTVLSLTNAVRVPVIYMQLLIESLLRVAVATVGGGMRSALAALRASVTAPTWVGQIWARRSRVRATRRVRGAEIADLQERGSARFKSFWRRRRAARPSRPSDDLNPLHTRFVLGIATALLVFLIVGSRQWISGEIATVGEFLPFSDRESPLSLLADYFSGWWQAGFGQSAANPTGILIAALVGFAGLGQLAVVRLVSILGLVVLGWIGVWKFAGREFGMRSRVMAVATYALLPPVFVALASGMWGVLVAYAGLPWWVRALGRDQEMLVGAKRTQAIAVSVLLAGVVLAFEPSAVVLFAWVALWWSVASLLDGDSIRRVIGPIRIAVVAIVGGFILNLPSAIQLLERPHVFTGLSGHDASHLGLVGVASLDFDSRLIGPLTLAVHALPLAALLLARGRYTLWATRSVSLSLPTLIVMYLVDRQWLSVPLPANVLLSLVVSLAAAIAVLTLLGSALDRPRSGQSRVLIAVTAVGLIGVVPSVPYAASGDWGQPETTLAQLLSQLEANPVTGDYHVAYVGSRAELPLGSSEFAEGLHYAVSDDGPLTFRDRWVAPDSEATTWLAQSLRLVADGSTVRAGRLLGPLAVRYVVVPLSAVDEEATGPIDQRVAGFVEALANQLDMRRTYVSSSLVIYENASWIPTLARLSDESAVQSLQAGADALSTVDLSVNTVLKMGDELTGDPTFVEKGTIHFASPHSSDVVLNVGGVDVQSRVAFGGTMAFDSPVAGLARLELRTPWLLIFVVFAQIALWLLTILAIGDLGRFKRRSILRSARVVTLVDPEPAVLRLDQTDQTERTR
jgi:GT2 family glycosyltransferase